MKPLSTNRRNPISEERFTLSASLGRTGFTLVELLAVVVGILLLMSMLAPALSGIKGAQNLTNSAYEIAGILGQARAYAMANNTYVWVGITEVNALNDPSAIPQTAGTGRVALWVVASKNGERHYNISTSNQGSDWQAAYAEPSSQGYQGRHLVAISKLQRFENIHLAATLGVPPASGNMARPTVSSPYLLGDSRCKSETPFTYPLGSNLASNYQYRFDKAIEFNPEGVARITFPDTGNKIVPWMEINLQHTHGNVTPAEPSSPEGGNHVAIQLEGMTGATRIYRP